MYDYISSKYQTRVDFSAPTKDGRMLRKFRINGQYIRDAFRDLGIVGQSKDNKRLPKDIHSYCKKDVCEFIGGYFDADGCIYHNSRTKETFLKLTSANYAIIDEMRFLLQKLGIRSNVMYEKMGASSKSTRGHYNLIIKDRKSILVFHENIKFWIKKKQRKFNLAVKTFRNTSCRKSGFIKGLRFELIKSVECIGMKPIYNLTAGVTHTYVANGIVTHNTGGDIDKGSRDFKKAWSRSQQDNFCEVNRFIRFVVDAKRFYFYGSSSNPHQQLPLDSPLFKLYKPHELIGVECIESSEKDIKKRREDFMKAGNIKDYNEFVQNNPLNEAEIFKKTVVNDFNSLKLAEQSDKIFSQPKRYNRYKLEFVLDDKKMIKMPYEVTLVPAQPHEDENECCWIIDTELYRKGYRNLYSAGADSYDQDRSKTSKSLGAMCVTIRMNSIEHALKKVPVAVIRCRPKRKEKFYELCLKLCVYYDLIGQLLVDVRNPGIIQYFKERGCEKYLAIRPQKFEKTDSSQQHEYGLSLNTYSKPLMVSMMQSNIEDHIQDHWFDHEDENGPRLIGEVQNYDEVEIGSDNDLADAWGLSLVQDVSCEFRPVDNSATELEADRFRLSFEKDIHNASSTTFRNSEMDMG